MSYNRQELLNCLKNRFEWYQKSIYSETYEHCFDFPDGNMDFWKGAAHELQNIIDMLEY